MLLENLRKSIQIRGLRSAPSENDFMESPTEWYYAVGNEKRGPVSWHQLVQLAATGVLTVDNLIWCEGMNEWQVAELADGLWGEPDWHYAQNGKQLDPVNWVTLRRMAREGTLQLKDLLWHESLPDWIEAARVEDLFPKKAGPPPILKNAADKFEIPQPAESIRQANDPTAVHRPTQADSPVDVDRLKSLGVNLLTRAKDVGKSATEAAVAKVTEVAKKAKQVATEHGAKAVEKASEAAKVARHAIRHRASQSSLSKEGADRAVGLRREQAGAVAWQG